jgi:hypothetical protein
MSKMHYWTQESLAENPEFQRLVLGTDAEGNSAYSSQDIQRAFGGPERVSKSTIYRASQRVKRENNLPFTPPEQTKARQNDRQNFREKVLRAIVEPPIEKSVENEDVNALKKRIILLEEQLRWAQKADPVQRCGGIMTLIVSDIHLCGRDHMIRSYEEICEKTLIVQKQYHPKQLRVILNGDAVAGTGIYRNQYADTIVQSSTDQVKMAAYKIYAFDQKLKESLPDCEVKWFIISGNHDRSMGENITPYFASMSRDLGVDAIYCGDSRIINLASAGTYNLYAEHGYGYSKVSPSGASWIQDMAAKLLNHGRNYYGENRIRRVNHGHTHWFQIGVERWPDIYVDTTGGCQRNERTILGKSPRPMGFIAYISPEGYNGILEPIGIRPDLDTFDNEWNDPELYKKNMEDCGETISAYERIARENGIADLQVWEGR